MAYPVPRPSKSRPATSEARDPGQETRGLRSCAPVARGPALGPSSQPHPSFTDCAATTAFGASASSLPPATTLHWQPALAMRTKSLQSCWTLCDPMACSPPGSSVCAVSQARILKWTAMPSSRGSSQPRDRTQVSCIGRRVLYH